MTIRVDQDGEISLVTIDRPEARNAVNPAMAAALFDAFTAFENNPEQKVAVLTGCDGAFCAGFDLKHAAAGIDNSWIAAHELEDGWKDAAADPRKAPMGPTRLTLSKPVIAAIGGPAVAGGMELALWCDLRVMEEQSYMGVYCRRWGVPLIDGGTVRLPRMVGHGRAMDLILTGRKVDAAECLDIGLANRICASGEVLKSAIELARAIARFPQACMKADRGSALAQWNLDPEDALRTEWRSADIIRTEGAKGASRFAAGKGRSGDFGEI